MEAHDALREDGLLLSDRAEAQAHLLADGVHGVAGPELLEDFLEGLEVFAGSDFADDEAPVLGLAGVPADEDELLHRGRVTCSLHLMICTCLKAK